MTADRREDALDWGDPDDPSWVDSGDAGAADASVPSSRATHTVPAASAPAAADRRRTATTAATGIFGGVYLAYAVGWILSVGTLPVSGASLLIEVMYQFGEFLAIVACALWFGTVMAVTRGGRPATRLGWLALGTLVLIPWPLIIAVIS
jgi:hypothetical protein